MKRALLFLAGLALAAGLYAQPAPQTCDQAFNGSGGPTPISPGFSCIELNAVQTNVSNTNWVTLGPYSQVYVQIQNASGQGLSNLTVTLQCRSGTNMNPYTCGTYTAVGDDVTAVGVYDTLPRGYQYRLVVSNYVAGVITANFEYYK